MLDHFVKLTLKGLTAIMNKATLNLTDSLRYCKTHIKKLFHAFMQVLRHAVETKVA